jgi:DNA invertase Pin-like site-specific DNA recombinase
MRPRRVLGYARVSSEEQAKGTSLDDQQATIRAYARSRGLTVARLYVEAESAVHEKIERREQIRALLADVREGDLVVCDKLDRWSRDPEFTYGSIRRILEASASFFAVGDQCDPSTRDGDTMLGVRVLVAREEHKRIRERMVGTRKRLRDAGYYVEGLPPYGYRRAHGKGHRGVEKNILVIDQAEAAEVRRVYALCASGYSLTRAAEATGLTRDRCLSILRSRVYLGETLDSSGRWIRGRHEAIIDALTWARAERARESRRLGGPRPRGAPAKTDGWMLRDVAACALCGARLGVSYGSTRDYYACSRRCGAPHVRVDVVEGEAAELVAERLAELRELIAAGPSPRRVPARDWATERAKVQRRRERLLDAYQDGHLSRDELRERMAKLDADGLRLAAAEAEAEERSPLADPQTRRATLAQAETMRRAWARADGRQRRAIVGHLVEVAELARDEPVRLRWRSVEDLARGGES